MKFFNKLLFKLGFYNQDNEIFKCRCCGLKKKHKEASNNDISVCQDCFNADY
jgi:hypothetical protein